MTRWLVTMFAVAVAGCFGHVEENRPTFRIDLTKPFRLEFGRGSGWHGLDTIRFDQEGRVVLHRIKQERQGSGTLLSWETATLQFRPAALAEVLQAVEANGLMKLRKAYHGWVMDGIQWVFWVRQGEYEKSVYFDNNFPDAITQFAEQLDRTLAVAGADRVEWRPVPLEESRMHEGELWDSIKR